jgi:cytochrome c553
LTQVKSDGGWRRNLCRIAVKTATTMEYMSILPWKQFEAPPVRGGSRPFIRVAALAIAASVAAGLFLAKAAAAPTLRPGPSDDFRAAFATSQEVAEGKRVADASCARCHGGNGISTAKGVPHLAGQRAVFLHQEMKAWKSGARGKSMMADAAKFLSDDALVKVAAWYATLDPALPISLATPKAAASGPDPVSAGKAAASGCGSCHGDTGISKIPGMPSLAGLDPKYLVTATNAYQGGQRKHDLMKALVSGLGEADVNNIAVFYAAQKPGRAQTPAPGNVAAG